MVLSNGTQLQSPIAYSITIPSSVLQVLVPAHTVFEHYTVYYIFAQLQLEAQNYCWHSPCKMFMIRVANWGKSAVLNWVMVSIMGCGYNWKIRLRKKHGVWFLTYYTTVGISMHAKCKEFCDTPVKKEWRSGRNYTQCSFNVWFNLWDYNIL